MDEKYMKRAIELAKKGEGLVSPNPLVGAVIVKDGKVIGEGYHKYYGGNHAEIEAFNSANDSVEGATMYVTLEPCFHKGKTPPCVKEIIKRKIKRVVIGIKDPNPLVAGKSIELLKDEKIQVQVGLCSEEIKILNEEFIKYITTKEPFCILKSAMTLDGKIATKTGDSKWITNEKSREYVHQLRNRVSAIMVGVDTIIKDDPMLNTRLTGTSVDPLKIIVDTRGRIPIESRVVNMDSDKGVILATTNLIDKEKEEELKNRGVNLIKTPLKNDRVDLKYLFKELGNRGIDSLLIEGGGTLNDSLLREDLIDKIIFFIGPKIIGGKDSKSPVEGMGVSLMRDSIEVKNIKVKSFEDDVVIEGYVRRHV
ncbi:MAG: bifunctional diaminohydroxyphosphoribosylaminopyrimidine deaminase/5-amino-6-(5-phosphoribosylamino)uracil reductase RibD [Anaeromicrobium sp.]|jgi:diaminohydroxyphosphoribosylaminopyrimidine deaminase/5-amino-6-(5-phosphoribosylamino)uracil reductase|uniref:bifunctional diaminohydroxyphosphoribosylaminopyrimidine deaminase/5-amino-6-(5-phosphoribosylamino)uracil reductase RibD n=1 Tax=Anaeromicrobium sp. TaxID=1929132 RepID=UPI0025F09B8E|nr:bifunctional diaminohydroxyphosphoribosylaminopyrimidine deaminase/5-amino-6-(5-phosphoribosylamino)uracil reductase RibD [Anaeromicrobium sp.]MCT4594297.1 bifunctional diaminohydroxyphosphoribosylaminopyrimidine deaminase/5-amino-6-(5-phosphoribosylamino)uracil reductase RibD [Anaeromicrobium sp.]